MRKLIGLLLLSSMLFALPVHATEIDLSHYSIEELVALKDRIIEELTKQGYSEDEEIQSGTYIVGVDIAAGVYKIFSKDEKALVNVFVYADAEAKKSFDATMYSASYSGLRLRLEDNNILVIGPTTRQFYISKAPESSIFNP